MRRKVFAEIKKVFILFVLILPGLFVALPVILLITGSVMAQYEL